jgi:hypothetical protein
METKIEINAIVWSTNIETAKKYAREFSSASENENYYYTSSTPEYNLNVYVRCPTSQIMATPSSITDIVIIQIEDNEEVAEAKKYLDSRRGIPMKVCLTTKVGEFDELECKNVNPTELANERNALLKEALSFETTLINVFKKFDLNVEKLIRFQGGSQLMSALIGSQISMSIAPLSIHRVSGKPGGFSTAFKSHGNGNINVIGIARSKRINEMPEILTLNEILRISNHDAILTTVLKYKGSGNVNLIERMKLASN